MKWQNTSLSLAVARLSKLSSLWVCRAAPATKAAKSNTTHVKVGACMSPNLQVDQHYLAEFL